MKYKIIKLEEDHPAKQHGYNYNLQILTNGIYCGNGKFFKTLSAAKNWEFKSGAQNRRAL